MAFNRSSAARQSTTTSQNDSWKAQGFINIYVPRKNGTRGKLGAIPLRDARVNEADLRAWLEADESNVKKLASMLIVEYQSSEPNPETGFALD